VNDTTDPWCGPRPSHFQRMVKVMLVVVEMEQIPLHKASMCCLIYRSTILLQTRGHRKRIIRAVKWHMALRHRSTARDMFNQTVDRVCSSSMIPLLTYGRSKLQHPPACLVLQCLVSGRAFM